MPTPSTTPPTTPTEHAEPHRLRQLLFALLLVAALWWTLSPATLAASTDDDLADQIARARDIIEPDPTTPNTTVAPAPPPPLVLPDPTPQADTTHDAATFTSSPPPSRRSLVPAATVLIIGVALIVGRRRLRHAVGLAAKHLRRRHGPVEDNQHETVDAVEVGTYRWVDAELRLLMHSLRNRTRCDMGVQLVQLDGHSLEVAFVELPDIAPLEDWTSTADRVWKLDLPHDDATLAAAQQLPAVNGTLIDLAINDEHRRVYINAASFAGLNITGEPSDVHRWIKTTLRQLCDQSLPVRPRILVVDDPGGRRLQLADCVELVTESDALTQAHLQRNDSPVLSRLGQHNRRTYPAPVLVILLTTASLDDRWEQIAATRSVAVLSTTLHLTNGLDIDIDNETVTATSLGLIAEPAAGNSSQQDELDAEFDEATDDQGEASPPSGPDTEHSGVAADPWQPPAWTVMINVLGTPSATKQGDTIKLTGQQLSALALIAIRREIPAHDFKRAIWGDEDDVSAARVRDMLSVLRKKVGGLTVIPKREDGLVTAGADLGCDLLVFEALQARTRAVPDEHVERLHQMVALLRGRPFNYSTADQTWWRWSEIAYGMTDWTYKATTSAETLARIHLERAEPATARDIAERGLAADPLNAALTEILMEAYARLGKPEASQRTYESLDRSLGMSDLGGASKESLHILNQLKMDTTT